MILRIFDIVDRVSSREFVFTATCDADAMRTFKRFVTQSDIADADDYKLVYICSVSFGSVVDSDYDFIPVLGHEVVNE